MGVEKQQDTATINGETVPFNLTDLDRETLAQTDEQNDRERAQRTEAPQSTPFANTSDYRILRNDWPYATPPDIAHLVIWLKTPFRISKPDGHLLPEGRAQIQAFVDRKFTEPLKILYGESVGDDRVLWFKKWTALQSVGALEHFHCFVRGAGEELLREWTGEGQRQMM
ncbi:MAG: hypothetical protein Q9217_004267 [Psora testacea]